MAGNTAIIILTLALLLMILIVGFLSLMLMRKSKKRIDAYSETNKEKLNDDKSIDEINRLIMAAENLLAVGDKQQAREIYIEISKKFSQLVEHDEALYRDILNLYSKLPN